MNKKIFKAAAVNMDCELGNVKANLKKMADFCKEASTKGALAICFPELATTGYSPTILGEKYYEISEPIPGTLNKLSVQGCKGNRTLYRDRYLRKERCAGKTLQFTDSDISGG